MIGEIAREIIDEFYNNLRYIDGDRLRSSIRGTRIDVAHSSLIKCFGLKDFKDDYEHVSLKRNDLFLIINDEVK